MASGGDRSVRGQVVGTGAILQVATGQFRPRRVELYNTTTGISMKWLDNMPADSGFKTAANGAQSFITPNGITSQPTGFQLGTDAINTAGNLITWECWGS